MTGFTFSQKMVNSNKGPQSYVVQFGTPKPLSSDQAKKLIQEMEARQKQIQDQMQLMMHDIFGQQWGNTPIFMPIIVMPSDSAPSKTTK